MRWITGACASAALAFAAGASAQPGAPDAALARDILRELVSIRTVHPDGDNTAAARAVARRLLEAGFDPADVQVLEPAPRKGNLVARLRGSGTQKPILLLAHIDVVEARKEDWSGGLDPWTLTERDGWLYGRGVLDDKGPAALLAATMIALKRQGFRPARDIVLALTADEEGGTHNGVQWLLDEHRSPIDAGIALNEGGHATVDDGRPAFLGVQVSAKLYQSYELEAANKGGHSSVPVPENAIYDLAAALERISRLVLPARIGAGPRGYAARLLPFRTGTAAEALRAVVDGTPTEAQLTALSADPSFNAQLRATCVATLLEGGHAENALPQRAKVTVNCRLLPGEDPELVKAELERAAGPRVRVSAKRKVRPSPESDPTSPAMKVIEREARATWPGVRVSTVMSAGATDGSRLRNAGIPVYGLVPIFMETSNWYRMHGRDERIPAGAFEEALGFLARVVRALAAP